jgi:GNAT superfamily N-acetyltransferase
MISAADSGVRVDAVRGAAIEPYLGELARLRIEVFREYPYLYEGTAEYEETYLRAYAQSKGSVVVLARDGDRVVGAATALPLRDHTEELAPALSAAGFDPECCYYFGESVLLRSHRGRGIGHAFFDHREAAGRDQGFTLATFCAVQRPENHPRKPADYVPHDAFWRKRGYTPRPDVVATMRWRDLDEPYETPKRMLFWTKELAP